MPCNNVWCTNATCLSGAISQNSRRNAVRYCDTEYAINYIVPNYTAKTEDQLSLTCLDLILQSMIEDLYLEGRYALSFIEEC